GAGGRGRHVRGRAHLGGGRGRGRRDARGAGDDRCGRRGRRGGRGACGRDRAGHRQRGDHGRNRTAHRSLLIRSDGLTTSVRRTPKRSLTTTTSPCAIRVP